MFVLDIVTIWQFANDQQGYMIWNTTKQFPRINNVNIERKAKRGMKGFFKNLFFALSRKVEFPRDDVGFVTVPWELFCVIVSRFLSSSQ